MAITTRAGLAAARKDPWPFFLSANSTGLDFLFFPPSNSGNLQPWNRLWSNPATFGSGGSLLTKASAGMLPFASPVGGEKCYLARQQYHVDGTASTGYGVRALWYDLVWGCSGFNGTVTTPQAVVGFPALSRPDANGTGLDLILVNLSSGGGTLVNATISYTNESGTAGRTAVTEVTKRFDFLGLTHIVAKQSGDRGVQSVQSLTFSATTGNAGNVGLFLGKLVGVAEAPLKYYDPVDLDYARAGMTEIHEDAALMPIVAGATAGRAMRGVMSIAYG